MRADPDMVVCRCCRQAYPPESFRLMGGGVRRRKCRACELGCTPGGSAHKAKVQRANRRRGWQSLTCHSCGLTWGRPISVGGPPRRCPSCRNTNRPVRNVIQRVVLGPCPCQGCGLAVTWNGYAWEGPDGARHFCAGRERVA